MSLDGGIGHHGSFASIALGCEPLGGTDWGDSNFSELRSAVSCAWEMGVRVFDTADVYGLGRSETELSAVLGNARHDAIIVTKGGMRWTQPDGGGRASVTKDASAAYLRSAVESSLKRLGVDVIPLYLVHWPDPNTPLEETLAALESLQDQGKVRAYGLSNFTWDMVPVVDGNPAVSAFVGGYNLVGAMPQRADFRKAHAAGLHTMSYGPLAQGLLSGKYNESSVFGQDDRRHRLVHFAPEAWPRNREILKVLRQAAEAHAKTMAQVAVRWVMQQGCLSNVIVGAKTPAQVSEFVDTSHWSIEPDWFDALQAL